MKTKVILLVATFFLGIVVNAQHFNVKLDKVVFELDTENNIENTDVYDTEDYATLTITYGKENYKNGLIEIKKMDLSNRKVITKKEFNTGKQVYFCLIYEEESDFGDNGETETYEYYFRQLDEKNVIILTFNYLTEDSVKYKGVALEAFLSTELKK